MTIILVNKLKKALKSTDPLTSVNEIISEYDELHRLIKWKEQILKSGENTEQYQAEINRINSILEENGYFTEMSILDDLDKEMRDYFNNLMHL